MEITKYVCCPYCKSSLKKGKSVLTCEKCNQKYKFEEGIVYFPLKLTPDLDLSLEKWDAFYKHKLDLNTYNKEFADFEKYYYKDLYKQLREVKPIRNSVYLEIGCGPFYTGQLLANECSLIIGIDISPKSLQIAKEMLKKKKIKNYLLILGDILDMPIKNSCIDLIYGGGVIEHFENTQRSVDELARVTRKGGVSFNTVPYLSIGSLTYRQIWGNIPNFPVVKQLAEFIHIKLLKAKHMTYGYELSFLSSTLKKMHINAGFRKVDVDKFDVRLVFEFAPRIARRPLIWLANNVKLFWPMVKVVATK